MTWRQTHSGSAWEPLKPQGCYFAIEDIAHGLSQTCRFGGQTRRFYSVAEHSVLVSLYGNPMFARWKLLHDAHEAIIGFDIPSPLRPVFPQLREIEAAIDTALAEQFRVTEHAHFLFDAAEGSRPLVNRYGDTKQIDLRILNDERIALLGPPPRPWAVEGLQPLGAPIVCLEPRRAKEAFLSRFAELFPEYSGR